MSEPHGNPSDLHSHGSGHHAAPLSEPKTPMWLPALGAALFLMAGLYWASQSASTDEAGTPSGSAPTESAGHH